MAVTTTVAKPRKGQIKTIKYSRPAPTSTWRSQGDLRLIDLAKLNDNQLTRVAGVIYNYLSRDVRKGHASAIKKDFIDFIKTLLGLIAETYRFMRALGCTDLALIDSIPDDYIDRLKREGLINEVMTSGKPTYTIVQNTYLFEDTVHLASRLHVYLTGLCPDPDQHDNMTSMLLKPYQIRRTLHAEDIRDIFAAFLEVWKLYFKIATASKVTPSLPITDEAIFDWQTFQSDKVLRSVELLRDRENMEFTEAAIKLLFFDHVSVFMDLLKVCAFRTKPVDVVTLDASRTAAMTAMKKFFKVLNKNIILSNLKAMRKYDYYGKQLVNKVYLGLERYKKGSGDPRNTIKALPKSFVHPQIIVETKPIVINNYNFGQFYVGHTLFDLPGLENKFNKHWACAVTPKLSNNYWHPHVNGANKVCLGNATELLMACSAAQDLPGSFDGLMTVLTAYNVHSCYAKIETWIDQAPCAICGATCHKQHLSRLTNQYLCGACGIFSSTYNTTIYKKDVVISKFGHILHKDRVVKLIDGDIYAKELALELWDGQFTTTDRYPIVTVMTKFSNKFCLLADPRLRVVQETPSSVKYYIVDDVNDEPFNRVPGYQYAVYPTPNAKWGSVYQPHNARINTRIENALDSVNYSVGAVEIVLREFVPRPAAPTNQFFTNPFRARAHAKSPHKAIGAKNGF